MPRLEYTVTSEDCFRLFKPLIDESRLKTFGQYKSNKALKEIANTLSIKGRLYCTLQKHRVRLIALSKKYALIYHFCIFAFPI